MALQRIPVSTAVRTSQVWGLFDLIYDTDLEQYFLGDFVTTGGIAVGGSGEGVTDHGALTGLEGDDHTQYHTDDRAETWIATAGALIVSIIDDALAGNGWQSGGGVTDHGALSGLADDDHSHYHTEGRANTWLATKTLDAVVDSASRLAMTTAERSKLALLVVGPYDHGTLTGLADDDHAQYHTEVRANTWLATKNLDAIVDSATRLAMTVAERTKLSGIATGANLYVHPNHTGEVTSVADGALTIATNAVTTLKILDTAVTLAKMANLAADLIIGRANGAGTGVPVGLTATQVRTIINVENGATADMTGAEIILALGTGITTERTSTVTGLTNGAVVPCNTTSGAFSVSPPPSVVGNRFTVCDSRGTSALNNITVAFGAALLNATNQSYIINEAGASVEFLYISATVGWVKLG